MSDITDSDARSNLRAARLVAEAGVGLSFAVALPVLLHPVGLGPALLPMHLPVLLTAALAGAKAGCLVGALAPPLSYLATGMPPVVPPIAPLMAVELAAYGLTAGAVRAALKDRARNGVGSRLRALTIEYVWLITALVVGRVTLGVAAILLGPALGLRVPALVYLKGVILTGIPGLVVQLALLPLVLTRLNPLSRPR